MSPYEKSRAAEFGFSQAEFDELLSTVVKRSLRENHAAQERARLIETLRLDDLVLARACARGHEGAWQQFLAVYRQKMHSAALAITREDVAARELADSLYADLFGVHARKDGKRSSKLESYLGRGSLEGWLRTVLAQEYVNRRRHQERLVPFDEEIDAKACSIAEPKPQNTTLADSTDAALAGLAAEERFLLSAYYLDGRTLAEIGRMLNVHESTISRRLEKITVNLRKKIIGRLRAGGFSKRVAEEMLESDVQDLNVDVRNRLVQEKQP